MPCPPAKRQRTADGVEAAVPLTGGDLAMQPQAVYPVPKVTYNAAEDPALLNVYLRYSLMAESALGSASQAIVPVRPSYSQLQHSPPPAPQPAGKQLQLCGRQPLLMLEYPGYGPPAAEAEAEEPLVDEDGDVAM